MTTMRKAWRTWFGRAGKAALILVLLAALLGWVAAVWVIPAFIRAEATSALAEVWDGSVTVDHVRFSYGGQVELVGVGIEDTRGRQWLAAGTVRIRLAGWPGLSPVIDEVDIDRLDVHLRVDPPIRRSADEPAEPAEPAAPPRRVRVHELIVSGTHGRERMTLEPMRLAMDHHDGRYMLRVESLPGAADLLALEASLATPGRAVEVTGHLDRALAPRQLDAIRRMVAPSLPVTGAHARLAATVEFRGTLDQPESYTLNADAQLTDGRATLLEDIHVERVRADLAVDNDGLRLTDLSCRVLGGRAEAAVTLDWRNGDVVCRGRAEVAKLDLEELARAVDLDVLRGGMLNGTLSLRRDPGEPLWIQGDGRIHADLQAGPMRMARGPYAFNFHTAPADTGPLPLRGEIVLSDWTASAHAPLATNLGATLDVHAGRIVLREIAADVAGGALSASGHMLLPARGARGPAELTASLALERLHTGRLATALGLSADVPDGWMTLRGDLRGELGRTVDLWISGDASATAAEPPHHLAGRYEIVLTGLGESEPARLTGNLENWDLREGDRRLLGLRRMTLIADEGGVRIEDGIIQTDGGEVSITGGMRRGVRGYLSHEWQFSCRDFDLAALLNAADPQPTARVNLDGTVSGRGADHLMGRAEGRIDLRWPGETLEGAAEVRANMSLDDLRSPDPLRRLTAGADLSGEFVGVDGEPLVTDLAGRVRLAPGERGRAHLSGRGAGGVFTAELEASILDERRPYSGSLRLEEIDLARLPAALGPPAWLQKTSISALLTVEGDRASEATLSVEGSAAGHIGVDDVWEASGDYEFTGRVEGLDGIEPTGVHGRGRLSNMTARNDLGVAAENVRCTILAFGRSIDIGGVHGALLGGRTHSLLRVDFPADGPPAMQGLLTVEDLQLQTVAMLMDADPAEVHGAMDFAYRFIADDLALPAVRGRGVLRVRDSQMGGVPLVQSLLVALGARPDGASRTDIDLSFDNAGTLVTLTGGRMATPVMAVSPEPGGTVNLDTHELDLYVVAGLLDDIAGLVKVPLLDLLVPFTARLSRLHVGGTWEEGNIQVRKEPLRDVGAATVELFVGAARTGGELGGILFQPIREVLP